MERSLLTFSASLFAISVAINLILINYVLFRLVPTQLNQLRSTLTQPVRKEPESSIPIADLTTADCGFQCQKLIATHMQIVDAKIATLSNTIFAKSRPATLKPTASPTTSAVKEFFIALGSGSTTKDTWEDVAGSDVYIDTGNFPPIKTAYFEASLRIPTKNGVVHARLYNVTDKHPVWNSDVSTDQDTSTFVSAKFALDPGNKQYRVQMRTTLQYQSLLDTARIKILTQ